MLPATFYGIIPDSLYPLLLPPVPYLTPDVAPLDGCSESQATWPKAEEISNQCGNDELFLCFYRELRNRHMFATTTVSLVDTACSEFTTYMVSIGEPLQSCESCYE